jgi:hypothetical protein
MLDQVQSHEVWRLLTIKSLRHQPAAPHWPGSGPPRSRPCKICLQSKTLDCHNNIRSRLVLVVDGKCITSCSFFFIIATLRARDPPCPPSSSLTIKPFIYNLSIISPLVPNSFVLKFCPLASSQILFSHYKLQQNGFRRVHVQYGGGIGWFCPRNRK